MQSSTTSLPRLGLAKRRAWWRSRWLILPIFLILAAAGYWWWRSSQRTPLANTSIARVSEGNLSINVSGSGTVAAARTIELPFQQAGTVTAVKVKVGDQVKAGQTLATIDTADLELAFQQAEANYKAAQASYEQTKNGTVTEQDIVTAQAQLASAKASLAQTKTGTATAADIASAKAGLLSAQAKLNALKHPTASDLSAAESKVNQAQTALQSTRNSASQSKTNAEISLKNSVNSLTQAQARYATAKQQWEYVNETGNNPLQPETTNAAGQKVANKLNDAERQQYYDAYVQADASLKTAENAISQAQVAYDTTRQQEIIQVQQAEASVQDAQRTLDALKNPSTTDLVQAQAAVTQAQANLDKLRQGGTAASIAQAQAALVQAQANLDKLSEPPTEAALASAEASVLQAQVNRDIAKRNLAEATLLAPFDGVVSTVAVSVGSLIGTNTPALTLIDRSKLHIDVNLSETDAAKVQVGKPVTITIDALPGLSLKGVVATLAPASTTTQNVVTYPAQIEFDPADTPIKIGMSATADIQIENFEKVLLVPSRAVTTANGVSTVTLLQGPQQPPQTLKVVTGASSNGQTVIKGCVESSAACLKAGDRLQVRSASTTTTTTTTTNSTRRNGFGGFGGGGGPPPSGP